MQTNFSDFVKSRKKGLIPNLANKFSSSIGQSTYEALSRFKQNILESRGIDDEFLGPLLSCPELISDKLVTGEEIIVGDGPLPVEMPSETAEELTTSMITAVTRGSTGVQGLSISSLSGSVVCFYANTDHFNPIWVPDYPEHPIFALPQIATTSSPSSLSDCLVYKYIWDNEEHYVLNNVVKDVNGDVMSLWNLLKAKLDSVELNSAIDTVSSAVLNATTGATDTVNATITNLASSNVKCVRRFSNGCANAWAQGSLYGLATYILSYAKSASSILNKDGVMEFSDNGKLIPQEYIVGTVPQICSTVAQFIGVVAAFFAPIIGIAISGIGWLITAPWKATSYDFETNTRAQLITDENVFLSIAPHAVFQVTASVDFLDDPQNNYLWLNDACELVYASHSVVYSIIPGGVVLIGPGHISTKHSEETGDYEYIDSFNIEIHPFITTSDSYVNWLADRLTWSTTHYPDVNRLLINGTVPSGTESALAAEMASQWAAVMPDVNTLNNEATESGTAVLSDYWDKYVRNSVLTNIAIIFTYMRSVFGEDPALHTRVDYSTGSEVDDHFPCKINNTHLHNAMSEVVEHWSYGSHEYDTEQLGTLIFCRKTSYSFSYRESSKYYDVSFNSDLAGRWQACAPGWDDCANYCANNHYTSPVVSMWNLATSEYLLTNAVLLPGSLQFAIKTPKYRRENFWAWVVVATVVTVAVVCVTVAVSLKIRTKLRQIRATNNAQVQRTWEQFAKSGNVTDYEKYRKAVKKNNRWQLLVGGTRYDFENYWNGDAAKSSSASNPVDNCLNEALNTPQSSDETSVSKSLVTDDRVEEIIRLIVGSPVE